MAKYQGYLSKNPKRDLLHFTFKQAKKLSSTKYSAVEEIIDSMSLSMSHQYVGNIRLGLKETLNKELLSYSERLGGVPLAFDHIKVINSQIVDDNNFFKLDLNLSFIVFKPQPGKLLNAVVNKITDDHFGCVVHNCINGSVRQPKRHTLTDEQIDVIDSIKVGDVITFKVWRLDIHHGILFVLGDIVGSCFHKIRKRKPTINMSTEDTTIVTEEMNNNDKSFSNDDISANQEFYRSLSSASFAGKDNGEIPVESVSIKNEPEDDCANIVTKSPKKKKAKKHENETISNGEKVETISDGSETTSIKLEPNVDTAFDSPKKKKRKKEKLIEGETIFKGNGNLVEGEVGHEIDKIKSVPNIKDTSDSPLNTPRKRKRKKEKLIQNETVPKSNAFGNEIIIIKTELNSENNYTPNKPKNSLKVACTGEKTLQGGDANETPRKRKRKKKNKLTNGEVMTDRSCNEHQKTLEKTVSIKEELLSDDDSLSIDESAKKRKRKRKHGINKC